MNDESGSTGPAHTRWFGNFAKGVQNALEVARVGRLTEPVFEPFSVVHRGRIYRLRHYQAAPVPDAQRPLRPMLLVPPLMLTSEVYDMSPESTAVGYLTLRGVDTFVVDYGSPEEEEGGLGRTLDEHVLAVDEAIDIVRELTGRDVHLGGYSQGGMFAYQCAALRKSAGIHSLVTFGSPVDVHLSLPGGLNAELAGRFIESASGIVRPALELFEGIPAAVTRNLFRMFSVRKELRRFVDFVSHLHDREEIKRGESRRTFLAGEGFVAWPGPAVRSFYDQFVVENRMSSGGFVIDGRTLTLADVHCPVLYFLGLNDDFVRPPAIRAIVNATTDAPLYEYALRAGHLGLVVGGKAAQFTWPAVVEWLLFQEDKGPLPAEAIDARQRRTELPPESTDVRIEDVEYDLSLIVDTAKDTAEFMRRRLEGTGATLSAMFDNLRWQLPRLAKLERIGPNTRISVGLELTQQASKIPSHTFFLYQGRAHTYGDADRRVGYVTAGLLECGIKRGELVGVLMRGRPTYLTVVAALSRLGAVAVLIDPEDRRVPLDTALEMVSIDHLITDPEHAARARTHYDGPVLVLGGGSAPRSLIDGVIDMERIDPEQVKLPAWYEPNPGKASDLALILFATGKDEQPRAARISNRRWAVAAYGSAAASTLTHSDTVYSCMPLHHAAGLLVSAGGALVGGARLALAEEFSTEHFWSDVRRYGASVVYYAGEMCRDLVDAPPGATDGRNPIRLFAGSGMRRDIWARLSERFNTGVLEFYATTEGNAVLANISGKPLGSLGRPLPGSADMVIVHYDFHTDEVVRGDEGWAVKATTDESGMLLARVENGLAGDFTTEGRRVLRDVFRQGDAWLMTGDVLRCDALGDYWFVDRAADMIHTPTGSLASTRVEDALYEVFAVARAVAYDLPLPGTNHDMPVATLVVREGYALDPVDLARQLATKLGPTHCPLFLRVRSGVPMSMGYRPQKHLLRAEGLAPDDAECLAYDAEARRYVPLTPESYTRAVAAYGGRNEAHTARVVPPTHKPTPKKRAPNRPKSRRSVPPPAPRGDD